MGINVLSLFDGMSCARLALQDQGIAIDKYYSSEIDNITKAVQIKYPDTIALGDVTKWKEWDLQWANIDLITSGSPCQGFSFAGKRLNFEDPRSRLFFVFIDILNHVRSLNPQVKYLLENVKMAKEHEVVISRCLGINPIEINSALLTAQNRKRLYWCNFGLIPDGMFGEMKIGIPQPKDKGILLRDILEKDVKEKYYLSSNAAKRLLNEGKDGFKSKIKNGDEKGATVFAQQHKLARGMDLIASSEFKGLDINKKAKTLRVGGTQSQTDKHNFDLICVASRGRNPENPKSREVGLDTEQQLEARFDGKTNCLTSVQKDNLVIHQRGRGFNNGGIHIDKSPPITSSSWEWNNTFQIRRLTVIEVCRLQGVPDDYFFKDGKQLVSDTAIYKACGNGWTIPVISYLFSYLKVPSTPSTTGP